MKRLVLLAVAVLWSVLAIAPAARAAAPTTSFALVVTNNRSTRLSRPDLRYADDDGAKYYELFRMLAPEPNVALLTTFDPDTQRLFPHLVGKARAPSKANVLAAARELGDRMRGAMAQGPVEFYFVFAGHGDVDGGKGFLELEGGAFTSDDLEVLLKAVPATRAHVILDSCNSFFVINSRKPGGKHFVTSTEATRSLSERLSNVGVFVSTSAEAEVFEWSELQAGVFSHAVRSGLAGAADADGDGRVSYDELRAFVSVATRDVKNPRYRPQVFARGPGGRGPDPLVDLTRADARRLRLDEAKRRVTVRDDNELPMFDLHKEGGRALTLHLPRRVAAGATIEELDPAGNVTRRQALRAGERETNGETALAALAVVPDVARARGADQMFRTLFAQPFGPEAFRHVQAEDPDGEPLVLGVSPDERERLRLLLRESADAGRRQRMLAGTFSVMAGAGIGVASGFIFERGIRQDRTRVVVSGSVGLLLGGWMVVSGIRDFVRPTFEERTSAEFLAGIASSPDATLAHGVYARAEERLLAAAERDRKRRVGLDRWLNAALFAGAAGYVAYRFIDAGGDVQQIDDPLGPAVVGALGLYAAARFVDSFFPTTAERMAELWRSDPGRLRSHGATSGFRLQPTFGLLSAGVVGTF